MYALLKPEAIAEARKYVQVRTPPRLQEAMTAKIDADFPPPPEALAAARTCILRPRPRPSIHQCNLGPP